MERRQKWNRHRHRDSHTSCTRRLQFAAGLKASWCIMPVQELVIKIRNRIRLKWNRKIQNEYNFERYLTSQCKAVGWSLYYSSSGFTLRWIKNTALQTWKYFEDASVAIKISLSKLTLWKQKRNYEQEEECCAFARFFWLYLCVRNSCLN